MFTIFDYFGYEHITEQNRYKMIRQAGFGGVALLWWNENGESGCRKIAELARKADLFIENIHTPFMGVNNIWLDNIEGETYFKNYLKYVGDCAELEIPAMVIHPSEGYNPPTGALGLERMKRIVEAAERKNVNIAFENLQNNENLKLILSEIKSPNAGFCYDSGHQNCRTPNEDLLSEYGSRLMVLHLHDNVGFVTGANEEDQHILPFDGTIDWIKTMKKIAKTGYSGAIGFETINLGKYNELSAEEFLCFAVERAKKLEAMM